MTGTTPNQSESVWDRVWDVVVIGAGPAGALTACLIARRGLRVALVERSSIPRSKVCGGCLNARGLAVLESNGLQHTADQAWGVPWSEVQFANREHRIAIPVSRGTILDRARFDAGLAEEAVKAGAKLHANSTAMVMPAVCDEMRELKIGRQGHQPERWRTKLVVAADGLGHRSLKALPQFHSSVGTNSRLGLSIMPHDADCLQSQGYPVGSLTMAVVDEGYLGISRIANHEFRIAAAIDAEIASSGLPMGIWMADVLARCQLSPITGLSDARVKGTIPLTRSTSLKAAERVFLLGDAAGYIEPITGEGMACALVGASALAPLAERAARQWQSSFVQQWERKLHQQVGRHLTLNRWLAAALHSPQYSSWLFRAAASFPAATRLVANQVHRPLARAKKVA